MKDTDYAELQNTQNRDAEYTEAQKMEPKLDIGICLEFGPPSSVADWCLGID